MGQPWVFSGNRRLVLDPSALGKRVSALDFVPPPRQQPLPNLTAALRDALHVPVGSPPLRELARRAQRVVVAVPDASRPCPTPRLLPAVLAELSAAGVALRDVQVLIACGVHSTTSADEKAALVGQDVWGRVRVLDAQGLTQANAFLGQTRQRAPAFVNLSVALADLVIAIGTVEPHLYAGFSGGAKTVAIGCAGGQTIAWTHSPIFLEQPGVEIGRLAGNPFQEAVRSIAAKTKLRFALDVVVNEDEKVVALAAGEPVSVQEKLAGGQRHAWFPTVPERYDVIIAGVPAPKSENFYQASRAATYLALTDRPALVDDGLILLAADLPRGAGDGPGERNFAQLMQQAQDPDSLIARALHGEPLGPGGQRAYMMAKVMRRYRVGVVSGGHPAGGDRFGSGARPAGGAHPLSSAQPAASAKRAEPARSAPLPASADKTSLSATIGALGCTTYTTVAEALADEARRRGRAARVLAVADAITSIVRQA